MNAEILLKHFDRISEAPDSVSRLRRFILDLAVRGKLVEQDPNDEPVSKLFKQIPPNKYQAILPTGWVGACFGDVFLLEYGNSLPADKRSNTGEYPVYGSNGVVGSHDECFVRSQCIVVGRKGSAGALNLSLSDGCCVTDVAYYCSPPSGLDLLFTFKLFHTLGLDSLGKGVKPGLSRNEAYQLPIVIPPLAEQQRIVAKVDELMALCDQLQISRNERETRRNCLVASSLNRINTTTADEAKNATRFHLDHFQRLTTRTEHIKQLRQSILSLAVRGLLIPQDPNDEPVTEVIDRIKKEKVHLVALGKIKLEKPLDLINLQKVPFAAPAGWAWRKIDTIVRSLRNDIRTGPFGSTLHKEEHRPTGVPVWGIESINKNGSFNGKCKIYVDAKKARELLSFAVKGGDIIISRSGTVGELCRLPDDAPHGLLSTNLMKISLDKEVVSPDYFCLLFKGAESIDTQLIELCAGSTRLFLTQSILAKLHFPLPPLAEQHRIVAKVDEVMALCDQLEAKLITTEADSRRLLEAVLRDALNTSAMTN